MKLNEKNAFSVPEEQKGKICSHIFENKGINNSTGN